MRVLLLSRYGRRGASSRIRSYQYLPYLERDGIDVDVCELLSDEYLEALYAQKSINYRAVATSYMRRIARLLAAGQYQVVWLEKEMFPWLPKLLETVLTFRVRQQRTPILVDYDDAIFHRYTESEHILVRLALGSKISAVMREATLVVVGNRYLENFARASGAKRVEYLPTVVDLERYDAAPLRQSGPVRFGWIGTPRTFRYLRQVAPAILDSTKAFGGTLVAIGGDPEDRDLSGVQIHSWQEDSEVQDLQQIDVGIMPIPDEPFERGKCGYKLIQYMACAKAVIASPVGENSHIVRHGSNGLLASSLDEWKAAALQLATDIETRNRMGLEGRKLVESNYSLQVTAPRLAALLRDASKHHSHL